MKWIATFLLFKSKTMGGETLYEVVTSKKQQKQFEQTWEYFCEKNNWFNDPYTKSGIRYLLKNPTNIKKTIGTIELVPYSSTNPESTVERHHSFANYEEIALHQGRVWEIDKLCLHKEYHRQGHFVHIIHVLYNHALEYKPKYYIGLMEKKFFRMARILLGLPVIQRSEALVFDESTLIPVVLDVESIMLDKAKLNVLLSLQKANRHKKQREKRNLFRLIQRKIFINK